MRNILRTVLLVAMLALSAAFVLADPTGPTSLSTGASSRYDVSTSGGQVSAVAGNVTRLDINGTAITEGWQGYFGNILGTIVLGDSSNNTMYDWNLTSVSGEVYASRQSSITWSGVNCSNNTEMTNEETTLNFGATAIDGINETFSSTTHGSFFIGATNITSNSCPSTNLYNSVGASSDWQEVVLADASGNLVFTSIVNDNTQGFDGTSYDFQLIVAEDGHSGDTATTNYYFWVELA